jgi:hypothetical protein
MLVPRQSLEGVATMVKKALALAALLLFATTGVAHAQDYPPAGDELVADDTTVAPGEAIVLGLQICQPASSATFRLDGSTSLGTATANDSGVARLTTTIPSGTSAGSHTIEGSCTGANGQPLTQVLGITITGAGAAIPTTGSANTKPLTQLAIATLAGGGLLVLLANRRRSTKHADRESVNA